MSTQILAQSPPIDFTPIGSDLVQFVQSGAIAGVLIFVALYAIPVIKAAFTSASGGDDGEGTPDRRLDEDGYLEVYREWEDEDGRHGDWLREGGEDGKGLYVGQFDPSLSDEEMTEEYKDYHGIDR